MTDLSRTFAAKGDDPIAIRQALLKIRQATKDLGTMAAQNSDAVDITGGTISGTDITVGDGKTLDVSAGTLTLAGKQVDISKIGTTEESTANVLKPDGGGGVAWGAVGNLSGNIVSRSADNAVSADTISEISSGVGVTADGVLLKDSDVEAGEVRTDNIIEKTAANGVAIEGVTAKDSFLEVSEIATPDSPAADKLRIYAKDNTGVTKLYIKDSAGTETELGAGGGASNHNDLSNIDGGTAGEYYHMTSVQHTIATQAASATVSGYVDTSAQTLAGVKTFSSSPVVPTPTTDMQAATKKYVDDNAGGGGGLTWTQVSADGTTATNGSGILANTTTAAFTVTLPATPSNGDTVGFIDVSGTCGTNNLTIARNGESIQGIAENLLIDYDNAAFSLVYDATFGWRLFDYQIGSVDYDIFALKSNVLELDNTDVFTPTADYHPSTKKYVDDNVDGVANHAICQGRLTLESGVPVSTTDQTAKTTLYFTPYNGNLIGIYSGTAWSINTFTELSLSLSGYTANKNYDIWIYDNSGTLTLDSTIWTDDTTRATALTTQDGIYVKSGATTRRYLGTIRITSTAGQCEDSITKRFVWNNYNRENRELRSYDTTSHTYTTGAWREFNNGMARITFVIGTPLVGNAQILTSIVSSATGVIGYSGIGLDATDKSLPIAALSNGNTGVVEAGYAALFQVASGYHYITSIEYGATTVTFSRTRISAEIQN